MKTAFHIEEKQSIRVVGYFLETTNQKGEARKAIPAFWSAIQKDHLDKNLLAMAKDSTQGLFGIHILSLIHIYFQCYVPASRQFLLSQTMVYTNLQVCPSSHIQNHYRNRHY